MRTRKRSQSLARGWLWSGRALGAVLAAVLCAAPAMAVPAEQAVAAPANAPTAVQDECDRLQTRLPELAEQGQRRALCVEKQRTPDTGSFAGAVAMTDTAVPERCLGDYPGDAWIIDRYVGCHRELVLLRVIEVPSGEQIGEVDLSVVNSITADPRALAWTHDISISRVGARGDVNGVIANPEAACDAGCTVTAAAPPSGLVMNNPQGGNDRHVDRRSRSAGKHFSGDHELDHPLHSDGLSPLGTSRLRQRAGALRYRNPQRRGGLRALALHPHIDLHPRPQWGTRRARR
ncbi:hypothetical protein FHU35_11221 [Saccharopolyspora dendranthemae]|uniref:Uncharacterized protein n=1 Tax=Saccharopolyspora dendranthemae TaxID=1181886 RepID=A0A561V7L6_9PSEU|nr:hypothetical protein FHU35_11221 [Saccharopolyspora dendranthemae]